MKRLIRYTEMASPKNMRRLLGFIVLIWFVQGVARGRINKAHVQSVWESVKNILLFIKGTVTKA